MIRCGEPRNGLQAARSLKAAQLLPHAVSSSKETGER